VVHQLDGHDITGMDSHRIARAGVAHSPEGRRVFATMSVTDNLLLGAFPRFTGARRKGDVQHDMDRAMDLFPRLKERRNQLAGTLSGGEQQMLAMARAIMLNPEVVLLDEPSMGLMWRRCPGKRGSPSPTSAGAQPFLRMRCGPDCSSAMPPTASPRSASACRWSA
jgi:ABC-type branched-subunit amino acid transport system ATPase component